MEISALVQKGKFAITAELGPPKGTNLEPFFKQAGYLKGLVHAANVTDAQSALMKMAALGACARLKQFGIEPILQMTVRDKNRIALQAEILAADALDIHNLLILTGDPLKIGDHPEAKPVFDTDAAEFMAMIKKLESGVDSTEHKLDGAPRMCIGAALNPCVEDIDTEISKTRHKIEKGAEFFQTQGVFDLARFLHFAERYKKEGFKAPILAGIILLKSLKMAKFMNEKIPGIFIPEEMLARLEKASDAKAECVAIASETIEKVRPHVQGVHLMAIGWEELIPNILQKARLSA
jgi:methylenetetrahydrofolate reductase (NADPH)